MTHDETRPVTVSMSESKGERTRRRLLDAAAAEVARAGIAGASITAIADAAGLKTGSIYFHFESKDKLIEAMLAQGLAATLAYLDAALAALPDGADAAARLGAAIRAHATAVHELPDYTVAVLSPTFRKDTTGAAARKLQRAYISRWSEIVKDAQGAGVLPRAPDPHLLRDLVFGALNTVTLVGRPAGEITDALEALIGLRRDRLGREE